jgi:hypothetical protein
MVMKGVPEHLRSDNGPEFVARDLRKWLEKTGAKTLYIEPGLPWENGYCESFNSTIRDEFLNGEIFYAMKDLRVLAERWRSTTTPFSRTPRWATDPQHLRLADFNRSTGRDGNRYALAIPSCPILQPSELRDHCATLTKLLEQNIGQTRGEGRKMSGSRAGRTAAIGLGQN